MGNLDSVKLCKTMLKLEREEDGGEQENRGYCNFNKAVSMKKGL